MNSALLPLLALALPSPQAATGEGGEPVVIGTRHVLRSELLDEDRPILVHLPRSYETGEERYPVLYLLDGPFHFHHVTGVVDFLATSDRMPETIVVAVGNTERTRDLTPSASDEMDGEPAGGGADAFLAFLCDELSPWVEAGYRTRPLRILVGHSFGGLFGVHALHARPGFFEGIIAVSPSMQWDEQREVDELERWLSAEPEVGGALFLTAGSEGMGLLGGSMKVSGLLSEHAPPDLRWRFTHMPRESHNSVVHRSVYDGLEFVFDGWYMEDPLAAYDLGGWAAIEAHFARVRSRFGYEPEVPMDGVRSVVFGLVSAGRAREALAFARELDPERHSIPPMAWGFLASCLADAGDAGGQVECLLACLERHPFDEAARRQLVALGVEPPPLPERPAGVEVSAERLAGYAGTYRADAVGVLTLSVVDGALHVQRGDEEPMATVATTPSCFTLVEQGLELRFTPIEGDGPDLLTVHVAGRSMPFRRVAGGGPE